jgi:hypothetical protein
MGLHRPRHNFCRPSSFSVGPPLATTNCTNWPTSVTKEAIIGSRKRQWTSAPPTILSSSGPPRAFFIFCSYLPHCRRRYSPSRSAPSLPRGRARHDTHLGSGLPLSIPSWSGAAAAGLPLLAHQISVRRLGWAYPVDQRPVRVPSCCSRWCGGGVGRSSSCCLPPSSWSL